MELWRPTDEEIAQMRIKQLTPEHVVPQLALCAVNLIALSVGLGKSTLADKLMRSALVRERFDLVVYAAAQTRILDERVAGGLPDDSTVVLRPRPRELCGALDEDWCRLEAKGCSAYARAALCGCCRARARCPWLGQLEGLERYATIMGTQAYFSCAPLVLSQRIRAARQPLVVLDEDLILARPFKHVMPLGDLQRHQMLLAQAAGENMSPGTRRTIRAQREAIGRLLDHGSDPAGMAPTGYIPSEVAARIQEMGVAQWGEQYTYSGTDLFIGLCSRKFRAHGGEFGYIWRPWLGGATVLVLSAELDPAIVQHRLGCDVHSIFPHRYTQHAGTHVYNISDRRLSAAYLPSHLPCLAVPYAQLVKREVAAGHRVLVVTRKRFVGLVCATLTQALERIGAPRLSLVSHRSFAGEREQVPVISYGIQGTNDFELFDTAICIGAYNANPRAVAELVNDVHVPEERLGVEIDYVAGQRTARVKGPERTLGLEELVRRYLFQSEFNTANQAVGRIRHCTRARTVFFCQQTEMPYELAAPSFGRFEGFKQHFGLAGERELAARERAEEVQSLKREGLTQRQVVLQTGLSLSTVKRRWR